MPSISEKDRLNIISLLEAIDKIFKYSSEYENADEFSKNERDFDASMMNFIVIGEMVLRLSQDFTKGTKHIDWYKIKGFRNIVAHDYFGIDAEEVWQIIKEHLPELRINLEKIVNND